MLFSPRWLAVHALAVLLVLAFLALGWWQLQRGESGNARSFGYAIEWPFFAAMVVVMWIKVIRDELQPNRRSDRAPGADDRPGAPIRSAVPGRAPSIPAPTNDEEDEELAAYNRYLAWLSTTHERQPR